MAKDPLEGISLKAIVTLLIDELGFEQLGKDINIRCFTHDPSLSSSLKFLRKTPWARTKVEQYYLNYMWKKSYAKNQED